MRTRVVELLVTGAFLEPANRPLVRICKPRREMSLIVESRQFVRFAFRFYFSFALDLKSEIKQELFYKMF